MSDVRGEGMDKVVGMILKELVELLDNEPQSYAGSHPSPEVHERQGAFWAEWDKQVAAWRLVLARLLIDMAIRDYRRRKETEGAEDYHEFQSR